MTARRAAAVLAVDRPPGGTPPGVDPESFRLALLEDVYEVLAGLDLVEAVLALSPAPQPGAVDVTWPGTPVIALPGPGTAGAAALSVLLTELAPRGYEAAVVVAADAPDLPGLLIGKLWRALGRADVALCPAVNGGLVALAARLPAPTWLLTAGVDLETLQPSERLRAAAPERGAVAIGPGWHRLHDPADLARLDPGLEGWESTRALLSPVGRGRPPPGR